MRYVIWGVPAIFLRALKADQMPVSGAETVTLGGWPVLVVRTETGLAAVINRCTHAAAAFLPGGRVRRGILMCPAHGARFSMADGGCIGGLYRALRTFPCREQDGWIEVDVPETSPGPDERPVDRP